MSEITVNKIEKKTVTLKVKVPSSAKTTSTSTNETTGTTSSVTVSVLVNNTPVVSERSAKAGDEIDCGTISGSGVQKIKVQINGKTVIEKSENIDDYRNNGLIYIQE